MSTTNYDALAAAARKLTQQAQTDPAVAARLSSDPEKAITEAAGCPLPAGVRLKVERGADGKSTLVPEIDPKFEGELDDKVLEAVSGGGGGKGQANIFNWFAH
jgi:hypothetical protein